MRLDGETRNREQIPQLPVAQLDEQVSKESPTAFGNHRFVERSGLRRGQVADTVEAVLPHSRGRPLVEIDAARRAAVQKVSAAERLTDIVNQQEWRGAGARKPILWSPEGYRNSDPATPVGSPRRTVA
jgi:hypothetical protein